MARPGERDRKFRLLAVADDDHALAESPLPREIGSVPYHNGPLLGARAGQYAWAGSRREHNATLCAHAYRFAVVFDFDAGDASVGHDEPLRTRVAPHSDLGVEKSSE